MLYQWRGIWSSRSRYLVVMGAHYAPGGRTNQQGLECFLDRQGQPRLHRAVRRPARAVVRVELQLVEEEEAQSRAAGAGERRRLLRVVSRQVTPQAHVVEDRQLHLVAQERVAE